MKKIKNIFILYLNSKLITSIEQVKLIETGIYNFDNNKKLRLKLLFRASRAGDNNKSYHDKCDGITPTFSVSKN